MQQDKKNRILEISSHFNIYSVIIKLIRELLDCFNEFEET